MRGRSGNRKRWMLRAHLVGMVYIPSSQHWAGWEGRWSRALAWEWFNMSNAALHWDILWGECTGHFLVSTSPFAAFASPAHLWACHRSCISVGTGCICVMTIEYPCSFFCLSSLSPLLMALCISQDTAPIAFLPPHPFCLLGALHCLFHGDSRDLGWLFSFLVLLGLCQCLSLLTQVLLQN